MFRGSSRTLWYVNRMDRLAQKGEDYTGWLDAQIIRRKVDDQLKKLILFDYNKRVENRAKKAATDGSRAHCQICERRIMAHTGLIAHHGYTRPGHGWQTSSCFGARHLCVEVSCDAMQPYIDMVTLHKVNREAGLKGLLEEPPTDLTVVVEVRPFATIKHVRPEGFSPVKTDATDSHRLSDKYSREWKHRVTEARMDIKNATAEIAHMTKRLAAWRPSKTQTLKTGATR